MQYPDHIEILKSPEFIKEANGNFNPGGDGEQFTSQCRAEPAGSNPEIKGADGNHIYYSWVVYMPKISEVFEFGDKATVTKADGSVYTGSVKRQHNGLFNTRLWV